MNIFCPQSKGLTQGEKKEMNCFLLYFVCRFIFLNDQLLKLTENHNVPNLLPETVSAEPYVELPQFSLGFWVVPITNNVLPYC